MSARFDKIMLRLLNGISDATYRWSWPFRRRENERMWRRHV